MTATEVALAWSPATDDVGVVRYEVWRGDGRRDNWALAGSVAGATLAFADGNRAPSTAYSYGVFAFDAAGHRSPASNLVEAATPAAPSPPAPPADLRAELLAELEGFAERTTGGNAGPTLWVTNAHDAGPGSLRDATAVPGAKWIRFDPAVFPPTGSTRIALQSRVFVPADTTIDGRGARVIIQRHGFYVDQSNVVITNLVFDFATDWVQFEGNNPIQIGWPSYGVANVWVHHNTFLGAGPNRLDGAVDVFRQAHDITISWNRFVQWNKASLLAPEPGVAGEAADRVSIHHNFWDRCAQRQPQIRFGRVHVYNNWYRDWDYNGSYGEAIVSAAGAQVLSEANVFDHVRAGYRAIISLDEGHGRGFTRDVGSYFGPGVLRDIYLPERVTLNPAAEYARYRPDSVATSSLQQALRDSLGHGAGWRP